MEYAARAGTTTRFWWGDDAGYANANCKTCGKEWGRASPVGSFAPNSYGLYGVNGNVWEWVEDCWHAYGEHGDARSDAGKAIVDEIDCSQRILRGGSWDNSAARIRSAQRSGGAPDGRHPIVGFRVARDR